MKLEDKFIMYVGNKAEKRDTVTGSNLYWPGKGSILVVDHTVAVQLIRHPDVWVEVDEEGEPIVSKVITPKKAAPAKPETPPDEPVAPTVDAVKAAILILDRDNDEHFTETGKPKHRAVSEALDTDFDIKLLNAAWKEIDG
mgnify:CR=1 FL=1